MVTLSNHVIVEFQEAALQPEAHAYSTKRCRNNTLGRVIAVFVAPKNITQSSA